MSEFIRMMGEFDYHKHTVEQPEYFAGRNRDNYGWGFGIFVALILSAGFLYTACGSEKKEDTKQQKTELATHPAPLYEVSYYPSETTTVSQTSVVSYEEPPKIEEFKSQPQPQHIKAVKISRYYEEGYEKGYDDGEDDAVMDNGWGGQFDDKCRYTGWKKKDYQLGYEEGYEAGYYDNKESDE